MKFLLPIVPNQVFETSEDGKASELRSFDLYQDDNFYFYFNNNFEEVVYNLDTYQNEQGCSSFFSGHLQSVAGVVISRFGLHSKVVEVGCGKGRFFSILGDSGFSELRGFDKSYQGKDGRIEKRYLNRSDLPLNADVLILRHVLEHVQNPVDFLNELREINGKHCHFVVEVPSTDWIICNHAFWDYTYEHVNYFTEESFQRIFERCDTTQVFNGQYLLAIGDSNSLSDSQSLQKSEARLFDELYSDLSSISSLLDYALLHGSQLWIWGGATKGVLILFHLLRLRADYSSSVAGIVDINPSKQNKFCAGTGVKINSPELFLAKVESGDVIIIVNPNYEVEVREFLSEMCTKSVSVVVLT